MKALIYIHTHLYGCVMITRVQRLFPIPKVPKNVEFLVHTWAFEERLRATRCGVTSQHDDAAVSVGSPERQLLVVVARHTAEKHSTTVDLCPSPKLLPIINLDYEGHTTSGDVACPPPPATPRAPTTANKYKPARP